MSLKNLAHDLKSKLLAVYVVLADAQPLRERAIGLVRARALPLVGPPAFNHGQYRATEPGAVEAFVAARTLPAMAERRLVEIRDLEQGSKEFLAAMVSYLKAPARESVVVLAGAKLPKVEKGGSNWAARIKSALSGSDQAVLVQIGDREVPPGRFVAGIAKELGKTIERQAVSLLVELIGPDLGRLQQEVHKLVAYVGEAPEIRVEEVAAATANLAEAAGWDLTAGIARADPVQTVTALQRLQQGGDDPRKLLGLLSWQVRELLKAVELIRAGRSDAEVSRAVRLRSDVLRRLRTHAASGSGMLDPAEALRRLATANRHMNSHRAGAERLLEGLVLEMLDGTLRRPPPVPRPR